MEIRGKVTSGGGEGSQYVRRYIPYFEQALGFTCFPGTLNIKVDVLPSFEGVKKYTVVPEEQDLHPVDCYLVLINGEYDGAIVIPHKTQYGKDLIEVIAPVELRDALALKDGDELVCELV